MTALQTALTAHAAWQASDPPNLRDFYGKGAHDFEDFQAALIAWHAKGAALWEVVEHAATTEMNAQRCPKCKHPALPRNVQDATGGRWTFWYHSDDPPDETTYCAVHHRPPVAEEAR